GSRSGKNLAVGESSAKVSVRIQSPKRCHPETRQSRVEGPYDCPEFRCRRWETLMLHVANIGLADCIITPGRRNAPPRAIALVRMTSACWTCARTKAPLLAQKAREKCGTTRQGSRTFVGIARASARRSRAVRTIDSFFSNGERTAVGQSLSQFFLRFFSVID